MANILLVEDDINIVKLIYQYIVEIKSNIVIKSFSRAYDAYEYSKNNHVDLFILDIQLTDYKGTSLAKQIRAIPEYKYTPIIFATALAGEELMAYREIKCYSFLIKPFTKTEFKKAFCDALGLSKHIASPCKTIRIEQKQFIFEYEIKSIAFIESFGKRIVIHTSNGSTVYQENTISGYSLSKMLTLVNDPMIIQCHKSYLVNSAFIQKIDKQQKNIILKNSNIVIPIGNKYKNSLWE